MILEGENIYLRDFIRADIEDRIRWETVEKEWLDWDGPWEDDVFDAKEYEQSMLRNLSVEKTDSDFRYNLQICIKNLGKHIGWVNSYYIDKNYVYSNIKDKHTIGIDIPDLSSREKGYATDAWSIYINYLIKNNIVDIYSQTWSGNIRVIGLMEKLGFEIINRKEDYYTIKNKKYDSITFKLNIKKYEDYLKKSKNSN